jgi:nucleoside-diphosphate-sugar epimerase
MKLGSPASTILVTGATGGFGPIFVGWLNAHHSGKLWRTGRRALDESDYVQCDLTDATQTRETVGRLRPALIVHLAGDFTNSIELDYSINSLGARHLIEALVAERIEARVVLIGSAAEYGVVLPEENPIKEDRVLRPVSVYGLTKAFQTQLGLYFAQNFDVEVVVARMFNLLAPGLSDRLFVGSVERQIEAFKRGEKTEIVVGNLDARRDYVSVEEAVEQLHAIATRGESGEIYHVGSGEAIQMRDLLGRLIAEAGVDPSVVSENAKSTSRKGYDVPIVVADMTKTKQLQAQIAGRV